MSFFADKKLALGLAVAFLVIWLLWDLSKITRAAPTVSEEPPSASQSECSIVPSSEEVSKFSQSGSVIIRESRELVDCIFDEPTESARTMLKAVVVPKSSQWSFLSAWLKPEAG